MDVEKFFKECLVNMGYITFEIAKKLKEKGYPFNTSHHYDKDGQEYTGDIEKYAWNVAQCEVGIAEAGEAW